jgi:VCBS repeat-containing protein
VTVTDDGEPNLAGQVTFAWTITNTNRAPVGHDQAITVEAGVATRITLSGADPDGDPLTFSIGGPPGKGSLSGSAPGLEYTAALDSEGADTITFTAFDGVSPSAPATVSIQILPYDPPDAGADRYEVDRDVTLVVAAPGVLANDTASKGALTARLLVTANHGDLLLNSDGSFTYHHNSSNFATDTFTYAAEDGIGSSGPIVVTINIDLNRAPLASADVVDADEDKLVSFNVLNNDTDPDGDVLQVVSIDLAANGTLISRGFGVFSYRPAPNWNGTEVLTYTAGDGHGKSASAQIEIVVAPVNDVPMASDLALNIAAGDSVVVDLDAFVVDPDGDDLTYDLPVDHFAADTEWIATGVLSLAAKVGGDGTVLLPYTVEDGHGGKAGATITINVSGVGDDLGVPELVDESTSTEVSGGGVRPAGLRFTGLNLILGSLNQTFGLFRLPLLLFIATFGMSLVLGLGRKISLFSGPVFLPLIASQRMACILIPAHGSLIAREAPGNHTDAVHRFPADQRDLRTTGRRAQLGSALWIEIETPDGDAWANGRSLTPQVDFGEFVSDPRPQELVTQLRAAIDSGGDLAPLTTPRGLYVSYHAPPALMRSSELEGILTDDLDRRWWRRVGDHADLTGSFKRIVAMPLAAALDAFGARAGVEPAVPTPVELTNLQSLAVGDPAVSGKDGWRIFFDYTEGEPRVFALWREDIINPAAVASQALLEHAPGRAAQA